MTRRVRFLAAYAYLLGAAMTFNFAVPVECSHVVTRNEFFRCAGKNVKDSAMAAIVWPGFWIGEMVK